ncbi:hypothetical protein VKT23_014092 [Stygiomarasmius scandens]|uniref:NAD-dependent epimerase/dehydratase domain-containing protein n=1 Tax=Marasmiellus scandens TaxID=2682957 RepID=A0ABR1J195_9AGAR
MESKPIVFVTGASGYLGFEIIHQLLEAGYRVRGSARGAKLQGLKRALSNVVNFEATEIDDVSTANFADAFQGVEAVIHTAAPVPSRMDSNTNMKNVVDGYLNIVRQAHKAGVKRLVVTSSIVSFPVGGPFGVDDWNPITEEAASQNQWTLYAAQKKFGDQAVFEYAKSNPDIDVTILSPFWVFGPTRPGFEHILPQRDDKALSSLIHIYNLLNPTTTEFVDPVVVDVRDVARLHLAALTAPPTVDIGIKRFAIRAPYFASYQDAIKYIAEAFPELKDQGRLIAEDKVPGYPTMLEGKLNVDWDRIEDVFGAGVGGGTFRGWKEMVVDTVRSLLELEKAWEASVGVKA